MDKRLDNYDWDQAFQISGVYRVLGSGVSDANFNREDVEKILAIEDGQNDGDPWIGLFKLRDGRYAFLSAGCDYTGWDCQAGGRAIVSNDLEAIIRFGLGDEDRERFNIKLSSKLDLIEDLV